MSVERAVEGLGRVKEDLAKVRVSSPNIEELDVKEDTRALYDILARMRGRAAHLEAEAGVLETTRDLFELLMADMVEVVGRDQIGMAEEMRAATDAIRGIGHGIVNVVDSEGMMRENLSRAVTYLALANSVLQEYDGAQELGAASAAEIPLLREHALQSIDTYVGNIAGGSISE